MYSNSKCTGAYFCLLIYINVSCTTSLMAGRICPLGWNWVKASGNFAPVAPVVIFL